MVFGGESDFTASEKVSFVMLDHYIEQGGNFIDAAYRGVDATEVFEAADSMLDEVSAGRGHCRTKIMCVILSRSTDPTCSYDKLHSDFVPATNFAPPAER